MMNLLGWDMDAWVKVIAWAGSDLDVTTMADERQFRRFAELRHKWLHAGGPMSGPGSELVF